ncbi:unnamed protein product [Parascedosporium putredinis]|uniref:Anticodon-binding domain-containing protein n=1 Tax=Parascedosporium putredinis TaxID=1442378 RepID=A0A9P1H9R1_9PEZI|nr:unnamed protein product [Parascedosporium putredinis]CAI8002113.1 unnamed protein product [Parascedosporium putredinis]
MTRSETAYDERTRFLYTELAGSWLMFAFFEAVGLRVLARGDDGGRRAWRVVCAAGLLQDALYVVSMGQAVGDERRIPFLRHRDGSLAGRPRRSAALAVAAPLTPDRARSPPSPSPSPRPLHHDPRHSAPDPIPRRRAQDRTPDHRRLGAQQKLFTTSVYSPGSPLLLPTASASPTASSTFAQAVRPLRLRRGRHAHHLQKALWEKSGHLENYAEDMFSVTSNPRTTTSCCGTHGDDATASATAVEEDEGDYGLKPMNCPGHCLIFASEPRISGALSGLTRVEREIRRSLGFVRFVYSVLQIGVSYRLALSTRPADHFIGTAEEWDRAESALKRALDASGQAWSDSDGKEHQTATIQLDFQLPKRFGLKYEAPAPELEARGEETTDRSSWPSTATSPPSSSTAPFSAPSSASWPSSSSATTASGPLAQPRQVAVLTVNDAPATVAWANAVRNVLEGHDGEDGLETGAVTEGMKQPTGLAVDLDLRAITMGRKKHQADSKGYGLIVAIGEREAADKTITVSGPSLPGGGRKTMSPEELLNMMEKMVATFQ